MKILHVIYTEGVSGAEKHIKYLLPGLKEQGFDVELLILCAVKSDPALFAMADEIESCGVNVTVQKLSSCLSFRSILFIRDFLKQKKISIVHSHLLRTDLLIATVKRFFNKRIFFISTKHGYNEKVMCNYREPGFKTSKDLLWRLTKFAFTQIDINIAVSKYIADLFKNLGLQKGQFAVIPHGLDVKIPPASEVEHFKKSDPQLLIVGRLEPLKGQQYVMDAMPEILRSYPTCKLILAGDGSERKALEKKAESLGITKGVHFEGFTNNVAALMAASDILVIPSLAEAFGLVFIEGMASSVPIVAFDVSAGNEIIADNVTGCLAKPKSSESIGRKIKFLLDNKQAAGAIVDNAKQEYLTKYTKVAMVNNTSLFYKKILSGQ